MIDERSFHGRGMQTNHVQRHRAFPFFRILPMFGISARVCLQVWFTREPRAGFAMHLDTEELLRAPLTFTTCDYQHNHLKPRTGYSFFTER